MGEPTTVVSFTTVLVTSTSRQPHRDLIYAVLDPRIRYA